MFRLLAAALALGAVGAITASQYSGSSGLTDPVSVQCVGSLSSS
jgi:hypothetical protein